MYLDASPFTKASGKTFLRLLNKHQSTSLSISSPLENYPQGLLGLKMSVLTRFQTQSGLQIQNAACMFQRYFQG